MNRVFRRGWLIALILLAAQLTPARAQVMTLTIQGIDALLDTARYGLKMAGQEDKAKQLDGLLEAFLQGEGFKGIDTRKPMGVYIPQLTGNLKKPTAVGFLPVTKDQDFLDFLARFNLNASKEENGVRSLEIPTGQRIYLRFNQGYVFVSDEEANLKTLADPSGFATSGNNLVQLKFNMDQVSAEFKEKFFAEVDKELSKQKGRKGGENEQEYQGRMFGMKFVRDFFASIVNESKSFQVQLVLDKTKHMIALESSLKPLPGTALAKEISSLSSSKTAFGSLMESAPASLVIHKVINEKLREELNKLLDAAYKKAMNDERSVVKKAVAEKVFKVLEPTLKSNIVDLAASLRGGQDGQSLTGIFAIRVKDGKKMEELARDFTNEMKEIERKHLTLDADRVGDVNLHVIEGAPEDQKSKEMAQVFGAAKITLAFHDEAFFMAVGKNSTEEVKKAVTNFGKSSAGQPGTLQIDVRSKAFTRFEKDDSKRKVIEKALSEVENDLIRISLTGGEELQFRAQASTQYLKMIKGMMEKGE